MEIILITEFEQLQAYKKSYTDLLDKVGGLESLYYSLDWIRLSLETFEQLGATLFFIVVLEDDEIVMVFPFQIVRDGVQNSRRTIRFWGDLDLYVRNSFQMFLGKEHRPDLIRMVAQYLRSDVNRLWDAIELTLINVEDETLHDFASLFNRSSSTHIDIQSFHINTAVNLDEHLGRKRMKDLRRYRRRLEEDFDKVEFAIRDRVNAEDLKDIKTIHNARQEHKQYDGAFFSRPNEDRYITGLIGLWNERKSIRYYSLRVDGKPIAINLMIHSAGISYSFLIAFDSCFKRYSPSRILEYDCDRHEGEFYQTKKIITGRGATRFKEDFATDKCDLHNVRIVNDRLRSRSVITGIDLLFKLRQKVGIFDFAATSLKKIVGQS